MVPMLSLLNYHLLKKCCLSDLSLTLGCLPRILLLQCSLGSDIQIRFLINAMHLLTHRQRQGTAQLAIGCWILVAAAVACVTWPGPNDAERVDLASASLPVIAIIGAYLSVTAFLHLGIGIRLRQGLALSRPGILCFCVDHLAVLLLIGKISLHNPSSPVYLTGIETVLGVLVISAVLSLTTVLAIWFWLPTLFAKPSQAEEPGESATELADTNQAEQQHWTAKLRPLFYALHFLLTLGLLYSLWQLDLQPLLLVS